MFPFKYKAISAVGSEKAMDTDIATKEALRLKL